MVSVRETITRYAQIGSDFYTQEEMAQFKKKKKKKRKTRKAKALTADDLLSMPQQDAEEDTWVVARQLGQDVRR